MHLRGGHLIGRDGGQHADADAVAPVEEKIRPHERARAVHHHRENRHPELFGQQEGPRLEAADLAVLRTRALGEDRHRGAATEPLAPLAQQLRHRLRSAAAVDADVAVQDEELPEEGDAEHLALRHPAEVEREVVERRDVDHCIVVQHDDIGPAAVDMLQPLDALPPAGRNGEEDTHQHARELVHCAAAPVEGGADDQRHGRQNHKDSAQQHQEEVV